MRLNKVKQIAILSTVLISLNAFSETSIKEFLKNCAYGTGAGALAGTISLAFVEKPSEHLNYISRGASLGLYGGIAYSLLTEDSVRKNEENPVQKNDPTFFLIYPNFNNDGKVSAKVDFVYKF